MLFGAQSGGLELRKTGGGSFRLRGSFPYNSLATLSDGGRNGGRPKKEQFAPGAFSYNLENNTDILFLSGHRFDKPLASVAAGTLSLKDTEAALLMDAEITPQMRETSWTRDFLAAFDAGLVVGLSPGFRIPPQRTVANAEKITQEDPKKGNAVIRTINAALLFELSAVTRAAYPEAQISARSWAVPERISGTLHMQRWRA